MQIHVWQQFSSNHSADFEIVGEFETPEAAQDAAFELERLVMRIVQWHQNNPNAYANEARPYDVSPTPIEIQIGQEYGINWDVYHEWLKHIHNFATYQIPMYSTIANSTTEFGFDLNWSKIKLWDRLVFFQSDQTWAGYYTFKDLMTKLGGKATANVESYSEFETHITVICDAPTEEVATAIRHELWRQVLAGYEVTHKCSEATLPWGYAGTRPQLEPVIEQVGNRLILKRLYFYLNMYLAIPELIIWLTDQGCSNVSYSLDHIKIPFQRPYHKNASIRLDTVRNLLLRWWKRFTRNKSTPAE